VHVNFTFTAEENVLSHAMLHYMTSFAGGVTDSQGSLPADAQLNAPAWPQYVAGRVQLEARAVPPL
jgi:hypothetical protein